MGTVFENEKHYTAANQVDITYLEDPYGISNYEGERKLLVIFQSLGDEKSDLDMERFPWTMVNGFRYLNCRKIYIKDNYGPVGCYYLGTDGRFDVEEAVLEFLRYKITSYGILLKDVMLYGNSKGGYASLNFGFRLGGVHICSAVPQFDLYSWIVKYKPHLHYIMPDPVDDAVILKYRSHLKNVIENASALPKQVTIITSHHDNTYQDHIPRLLDSLNEVGGGKNTNIVLMVNDELYVTRHNNVVPNSMNAIYYCISRWLVDAF